MVIVALFVLPSNGAHLASRVTFSSFFVFLLFITIYPRCLGASSSIHRSIRHCSSRPTHKTDVRSSTSWGIVCLSASGELVRGHCIVLYEQRRASQHQEYMCLKEKKENEDRGPGPFPFYFVQPRRPSLRLYCKVLVGLVPSVVSPRCHSIM